MWLCFVSVPRCIPCKGARFPPTLPRPAVAILPFKLPYCQVETEKGQMEVWNGVESTAGGLRCPWSGDYTGGTVQTLSKTRGQGVIWVQCSLVWFTTVPRRAQNKTGRADAKLYLHMICF